MLAIFADFHWPTFFISLAIFILVASILNFIKAIYFKKRAKARLEKIDKSMKDMFQKLKNEDERIAEIIKEFEPPSK